MDERWDQDVVEENLAMEPTRDMARYGVLSMVDNTGGNDAAVGGAAFSFAGAGSPLNAGNVAFIAPSVSRSFITPKTNVQWQGISSSATYSSVADVLAKA